MVCVVVLWVLGESHKRERERERDEMSNVDYLVAVGVGVLVWLGVVLVGVFAGR